MPSRAISTLVKEHGDIEQVLTAAEKVLDALEKGAEFPTKLIGKILKFLGIYANDFHTCHEEIMIPMLEEKGMTQKGSAIGLVRQEHAMAEFRVRNAGELLPAARKGDKEAQANIRQRLADYCVLLRNHIYMENKYFFREAELCLTKSGGEALQKHFDDFYGVNQTPDEIDGLLALVGDIEKETEKVLEKV